MISDKVVFHYFLAESCQTRARINAFHKHSVPTIFGYSSSFQTFLCHQNCPKMSHIHSCAVSCDKLAVQLLFRDASVVSQGTPRCWRGGNGHDLLVCVFMCMLSCFSCINEMCVYCIFLYNLRLYRERERMNHRNALCMPLFHHV